MGWVEHAVWWHVYPLGFTGAPIREPDVAPPASARLDRLLPWLDHAVALGANGLLLGPVFASTSHGYDTLDHHRIDPRLGDDEAFDRLVAACRARGLRLVLDGVFNHVGAANPLVTRALAGGPDGELAHWFRVDWDAPGGPRPDVFEGHEALVELNHDEPAVAAFVGGVMAHWLARSHPHGNTALQRAQWPSATHIGRRQGLRVPGETHGTASCSPTTQVLSPATPQHQPPSSHLTPTVLSGYTPTPD